jgi:broad specificity phosphatase PhoE
MTVFYIVRHGKIEAVSGDAPLSQQGLIEAHATAHDMRAAPIRHVYTSPLRRAKETAVPIAALHGLAMTEEVRLRERANWGDLSGQSLAEFVEMWERSTRDPAYIPPVGDSARQAGIRMDHLLRERAEHTPSEQMVMVTHGALITDFLAVALPLEQLEHWHPTFLLDQSRLIPECSITVVRLEEGYYTLDYFAGVKHLLDLTPFSRKLGVDDGRGNA